MPASSMRAKNVQGTLHAGKFYEGPAAPGSAELSNYTPGNTFTRLDNAHAPFTAEEWAARKQYRSWDMSRSYSEEYGFLVLSMQLLTQSSPQHLPCAGEERGRVLL